MAEKISPAGALNAALEAALLRQLGETWAEINQNHFRRRLRRPVFALSDGEHRLGAWIGARRTLELSRAAGAGAALGGGARGAASTRWPTSSSTRCWASATRPRTARPSRRCAGSTASTPRPPGLPAPRGRARAGHPVLRRIARLLALADSPNVHEAEAAMQQAAQRLMLRHNIDAATAAAREGFTFRHVGSPDRPHRRRTSRCWPGILSDHFFVEVIWVPSYRPLRGAKRPGAGAVRDAGQPGRGGLRARLRAGDRRAAVARAPPRRSASPEIASGAASCWG